MVKIKLPTEVYDKLYHMLVLKVRTKLGGAVLTATDAQLWEKFENSKYYRDLFKSKKLKSNHFFRKLEQRGNPKHLMSFDGDLFCDALQFLGYKIPAKKTDLDYTYTERLNEWGTEFLKKYFPQQQEYIDIVVNFSWRTKDNAPGRNVDYSVGRYLNLDKKVYLSEYRQGLLLDRAVLRIKAIGNGEINGTVEVVYQNPDLGYKKDVTTFHIDGWFNYNEVLTLRFKNADQLKEHAGVYLLKLDTEGHQLTGTYVAHYEQMPPVRESRVGTIMFTLCEGETEEAINAKAQAFINEWKGKAAPDNAEEIINDWERKFKSSQLLSEMMTAWLRDGKYEQLINKMIAMM